MKRTFATILFLLSFTRPTTSAIEKDDMFPPTSLEQDITAAKLHRIKDKREDIAAEQPLDEEPNSITAFQHMLVNANGNFDPVYLSDIGGTPADGGCDQVKIKYEWLLQVVKFYRLLVGIQSLFRISIEDLILHLESGTVDESWVGKLIEHGKLLKVLHKHHNKYEK